MMSQQISSQLCDIPHVKGDILAADDVRCENTPAQHQGTQCAEHVWVPCAVFSERPVRVSAAPLAHTEKQNSGKLLFSCGAQRQQ